MVPFLILLLLLALVVEITFALSSNYRSTSSTSNTRVYLSETLSSSLPSSLPSSSPSSLPSSTSRQQQLKASLFALCAACDRGFGAQPNDRAEIMSIVQELKDYTTRDPTYGLYPRKDEDDDEKKLLEGCWQMIYTNAIDVLSLAASPISLINGIYQIIESDGTSCNVIDLSPRIQALLPPSVVGEGSLLRLKVITRSFARSSSRVGLSFKSFAVIPKTILGFKVDLPFDLVGSLPQSLLFRDKEDGPGYFDIEYLDDDCLIIKQNAVAGYFISIRSKNKTISSF